MNQWLLVVLVCVTTWRATRLVTADDFPPVLWLRRKVVYAQPLREDGEPWWLGQLVTCPWCAGVYLSAAVTFLANLLVRGGVPAPVLVFGAAAAVAGWLGRMDGTPPLPDPEPGSRLGVLEDTQVPGRTGQINPEVRTSFDRVPRRFGMAPRDALVTAGLAAVTVGMVLVIGVGLALIISGAVVFALGLVHRPAAAPSQTEQPMRRVA